MLIAFAILLQGPTALRADMGSDPLPERSGTERCEKVEVTEIAGLHPTAAARNQSPRRSEWIESRESLPLRQSKSKAEISITSTGIPVLGSTQFLKYTRLLT